jgi:hypothetical protein
MKGDSTMARNSRKACSDPQLTLEDWAEAASGDRKDSSRPAVPTVTSLADALAPRLAEELRARIPPISGEESTSSRLLTLDQLVAELPPAKRPQTWKRWLYERTRRGEVPGCVKLGGMLFFEREPALAWLRAGATTIK